MKDLIRFIIYALAVYRVSRLIIQDEITDGPREWIFSKINPNGKIAYLLTCYWCVSFWVAIPLAILYITAPDGMMVAGLPLAGSAVAGFISQKVG